MKAKRVRKMLRARSNILPPQQQLRQRLQLRLRLRLQLQQLFSDDERELHFVPALKK